MPIQKTVAPRSFTVICQSIADRRRPRGTRRHHGHRFLDKLAIAHRPEVIADRDQFGHWECDLVMFRKEFGKANVTSLVERVSRFAVVLKNLIVNQSP